MEEAAANRMLREGAVKCSFANLLFHHRPLMIVDEAHNAVSGLTREVQARIRPAAILNSRRRRAVGTTSCTP